MTKKEDKKDLKKEPEIPFQLAQKLVEISIIGLFNQSGRLFRLSSLVSFQLNLDR